MTSFPIPRTPLAATIIEVAAKLVAEEGIASATIRNIATQANVLPPQIYKHVGGIDQLLDAAALHLWQNKPQRPTDADDTINGLYQAIEDLISFGLKNPDLYLHICKPRQSGVSHVWQIQLDDLKNRVRLVAVAGLLQVSQKQAIEFIHPFCTGMVFSCLHQVSRPPDASWLVRQAVKPLLKAGAKRTLHDGDPPKADPHRRTQNLASELRGNLSTVKVFSRCEHLLLGEWLERIAAS